MEQHLHHERALPWLEKALARKVDFFVCTHSLAELFSTLTRLPISPKITTLQAVRLIDENIQRHAKLVYLSCKEYENVLDRMLEYDISGASIYDALIAQAAQKRKVDFLLTFNQKDFVKVWPEGIRKIKVP